MREKPFASKASFLSLCVLAATFFMPMFRACEQPEFRSPAYHLHDLEEAAWIAPVFLFSAIMALLTAMALKRGQVSPGLRRAGLYTVAALAVTNLVDPWFYGLAIFAPGPDLIVSPLCALVGAIAATVLLRRARGKSPWQIWHHLLACFGIVAFASPPATMLFGYLRSGDPGVHLGPGAYVLFAALGALLTYSLGAVMRRL